MDELINFDSDEEYAPPTRGHSVHTQAAIRAPSGYGVRAQAANARYAPMYYVFPGSIQRLLQLWVRILDDLRTSLHARLGIVPTSAANREMLGAQHRLEQAIRRHYQTYDDMIRGVAGAFQALHAWQHELREAFEVAVTADPDVLDTMDAGYWLSVSNLANQRLVEMRGPGRDLRRLLGRLFAH